MDSEDAAQDAIVYVLTRWAQLQIKCHQAGNPESYLFTILRRRVSRWHSRRLRSLVGSEVLSTGGGRTVERCAGHGEASDLLTARQVMNQMRRAISQLAPIDLALVKAKCDETRTVSEVARRFGITAKAAYNRLERAMGRLRRDLHAADVSESDAWNALAILQSAHPLLSGAVVDATSRKSSVITKVDRDDRVSPCTRRTVASAK